ncbi:MAG: hypothetical protein A2X29_09750 [Elusimicrobia bacterium GWA2_64_40]|nr:MAG: hypothetical protein A2X29_09750 [Elusimicrobia bacterium GWA2_64_40]
MNLINTVVALLLLLMLSGNLCAGPASARLSALASELISGYESKAGNAKSTVAVFPFNSEVKLEKQRIGFAVSELMAHRFVASGNFTVVERGEIARLLAEQRLQASGAVDSATAVKLGKLAGAGTLLLGNVLKVDGKYQVNARLVNAETAEVVASGYAELEVLAFEDDARVYLNLVPETQALGLYFLTNLRSNANDLPEQTYNTPFGTETISPKSFTLNMLGGGIRYSPSAKTLVDVAYMGNGSGAKNDNGLYGHLKVSSVRALLGYKVRSSGRLRYFVGGGGTSYSLDWTAKTTYYTPTVFFRLEFLPQSRIGLSVSAFYDFIAKTATQNIDWATPPVVARGAKLNKFSIEPTLSVYF